MSKDIRKQLKETKTVIDNWDYCDEVEHNIKEIARISSWFNNNWNNTACISIPYTKEKFNLIKKYAENILFLVDRAEKESEE